NRGKIGDSKCELRYRRGGMGRRHGRGAGGSHGGRSSKSSSPVASHGEGGGGAMSDLSGSDQLSARIKVVGIGGGGGNAVNTMIAAGLQGVNFISANTDAQALAANLAPVKLQLGSQVTKGLGAGGSPEMGRKAATED